MFYQPVFPKKDTQVMYLSITLDLWHCVALANLHIIFIIISFFRKLRYHIFSRKYSRLEKNLFFSISHLIILIYPFPILFQIRGQQTQQQIAAIDNHPESLWQLSSDSSTLSKAYFSATDTQGLNTPLPLIKCLQRHWAVLFSFPNQIDKFSKVRQSLVGKAYIELHFLVLE